MPGNEVCWSKQSRRRRNESTESRMGLVISVAAALKLETAVALKE